MKRDISTVSHWVADGKISKEALVGEGRRQRIWYERARADLALKLDPGQQNAQNNPVDLASMPVPSLPDVPTTADVPALATSPPVASVRSSSDPDEDPDLRRKRRADADRAVQDAITAFRRNEIESGRWISADEVRKEFGSELAKVIGAHDTFVGSTLARALADRFGLDWKEISLLCRTEYRKFRSDGAEQTAAELKAHEAERAAEEVELIDDPGRSPVAGAELQGDSTNAAAAG